MQDSVPSLDQIVDDVAELQPLGSIATRILELTEGDRFSAHELATVISSDQALTAKMLRLSNSAYYGFPRRITTVRDAVVLLGFRAVRSATLASCVIDAIGATSRIDRQRFWQFSITVGMLAEVMGRAERTHQDEAFTAGVVHNIGRLALDQHYPDLLGTVRRDAQERDISIHQAERERYGWTDADVGGGLALHWNFPQPLVEAVRQHALPAGQIGDQRSLAALVVRSRAFAHAHGMTDGIEAEMQATPAPEWSAPPLMGAMQRAGGMDGVLERVGAFMEQMLPA